MSDDESKTEDRFVVVIVVLAILAAAAMAVLFVIFTRAVAWPQQTDFSSLRMFVNRSTSPCMGLSLSSANLTTRSIHLVRPPVGANFATQSHPLLPLG